MTTTDQTPMITYTTGIAVDIDLPVVKAGRQQITSVPQMTTSNQPDWNEMNTTTIKDYMTFDREVVVTFDPADAPEYSERKHDGRVERVHLNYRFRFDRKQWQGTAAVFWRWTLTDGTLGAQMRRDVYARGPWAEGLIAEHMPTSTIEFKEIK